MSRSTKKPFVTDQQRGTRAKSSKREANKAIRNKASTEEVGKGKTYKKEYNSWNIRDYSFHMPKDPKAKRK